MTFGTNFLWPQDPGAGCVSLSERNSGRYLAGYQE